MIVADDTGTDWLTLADRLDELATDRRWDCWNKHGDGSLDVPEGYDPSPDCCDAADGANALRAAADGLRQLADENRALRELAGFLIDACATHRIAVPFHSSLQDLMADIAGGAVASLSPTPTPDRCPTCDSDDRTKQRVRGPGQRHCPNTWHKLTED